MINKRDFKHYQQISYLRHLTLISKIFNHTADLADFQLCPNLFGKRDVSHKFSPFWFSKYFHLELISLMLLKHIFFEAAKTSERMVQNRFIITNRKCCIKDNDGTQSARMVMLGKIDEDDDEDG